MATIDDIKRRIAMALGLALAAAGAAQAAGTVGTTFPTGFVVPIDNSLLKPVIGFGAAGPVSRTPVVFLHGNNDTPYATGCSSSNSMQAMAQYFADSGYSPSELWALGYQGDQCDIFSSGGFGVSTGTDPTIRSSTAHTNAANVPDLRKFVKAVLAYTGASRVDIVAHGMGVTLAREFARQDGGAARVRRFVAIEGPNRGMIICSAAEGNPWALGYAGGYTPNSPVCQELGSPNTPFLQQLNKSDRRIDPGSTLVIRNTDASCLFKLPDGLLCGPFGPTPAVDSYGSPTDFSLSARISGANDLGLSLQGQWDYIQGGSAHFGIANSSSAWKSAFKFLRN